MQIRLANHADSSSIRHVFLSAFTPFKEGYTPDAFTNTVVEESTIKHRMDAGKTWVGEEDGEILGTVSVAEYWEGFYVTGMAVSPRAQGKKLGYHLLRMLENYAIGNGAARIYLYTTTFLHRAISLYEKIGFTRYGDPMDEWMGTRLIQFEKPLPKIEINETAQAEKGYEVLAAHPRDLDFICYLFEEAIAFQKHKGYIHWLGYDRRSLLNEIEQGKTFKILVGNKIACTFSVLESDKIYWREKDQDDALYLHRFVVNPKLRGQRHVAKILDFSKEEARRKGRRYLRMDTWASNHKIINLYTDYGFKFVEEFIIPDTEEVAPQYRNQAVALLEMDLKKTKNQTSNKIQHADCQ